MNIILSDNGKHLLFAPLTLTRPTAELRIGIWTNVERLNKFAERLNQDINIGFETEPYLSEKFSPQLNESQIWIDGTFIPTLEDFEKILGLKEGQYHTKEGAIVAHRGTQDNLGDLDGVLLAHIWHLFQLNAEVLANDFATLDFTNSVEIESCGEFNKVIGDRIFIEEGARINDTTLNTISGPIYIGKGAEIMEGTVVRGGLALMDGATLKLGTKIYGATTIGPHCKIGGEVSNSVFIGYSNKGHDGFMGNSLIGEWCNFGADTNTSNLKNNYSPVRAYNYVSKSIDETNVTFMGLIAGDHCKSAINTMFNTATVLGVNVNIVSGEFPPKHLPSFTWHVNGDSKSYDFNKAMEVANRMMARRKIDLTDVDQKIYKHLSE